MRQTEVHKDLIWGQRGEDNDKDRQRESQEGREKEEQRTRTTKRQREVGRAIEIQSGRGIKRRGTAEVDA